MLLFSTVSKLRIILMKQQNVSVGTFGSILTTAVCGEEIYNI